MTQIEVGACIIAITQGIKNVVPGVSGIITLIVAAVLGLIAGLAGFAGLNWLTGLATGLASAGTVTVATKIGENK